MCINLVKDVQAEAVSNEPSDHVTTRKVSSASGLVKSPSWPSFKDAFYQSITATNDFTGTSSFLLTRHRQDTMEYHNPSSDDKDITTCYQPVEERDVFYVSTSHSSVQNKGDEKIDMNGPLCEDHSANVAEETSSCLQTIGQVTYCMSQIPQPIWLDEDSPLVILDGSSQPITISVPTSSSGKKRL